MFPKRKINRVTARESYQDAMRDASILLGRPGDTDARKTVAMMDSHFNAIGSMLNEIADSIDMLFERIDNLERRIR